jgi:hypothetical protein
MMAIATSSSISEKPLRVKRNIAFSSSLGMCEPSVSRHLLHSYAVLLGRLEATADSDRRVRAGSILGIISRAKRGHREWLWLGESGWVKTKTRRHD